MAMGDTEETHLNSLASAPQISVDRLMAAIPTKQDKDKAQPENRNHVSEKRFTRPQKASLRHHLPMVKTVPLGTNIDSIGSPLSLARRADSVAGRIIPKKNITTGSEKKKQDQVSNLHDRQTTRQRNPIW
jgi:hypothetical protein